MCVETGCRMDSAVLGDRWPSGYIISTQMVHLRLRQDAVLCECLRDFYKPMFIRVDEEGIGSDASDFLKLFACLLACLQ